MGEVMHLALIPPTQLLKHTLLTSYQLVLPHMMKEDFVYNDWYTNMAATKQHYMILDNGEAEGFNYFSANMLYGMAAHLGFNELVVKDVMADMEATKKMTEEFFTELDLKRKEAGVVRFGAVVQGKTMDECVEITRWYLDNYGKYLSTLYIPRHLIATLGDIHARIVVTKELDKQFKLQENKIDVHFLGAHHHAPVEPVIVNDQVPWVRGMDTSMPFNYAWNHAYVGEGHHPRPENYFSLLFDKDQEALVLNNVQQFIRWSYKGYRG